jgi:hypothetical protein
MVPTRDEKHFAEGASKLLLQFRLIKFFQPSIFGILILPRVREE